MQARGNLTTPDEIEKECWAQLMACRGLVEKMRLDDGRTLAEVGYRDCYVWRTIGFERGRLSPEERRPDASPSPR